MIIGRKGSGKTTLKFKVNEYSNDKKLNFELNLGQAFKHVRGLISALTHDYETVESAADLWSSIIWAWFVITLLESNPSALKNSQAESIEALKALLSRQNEKSTTPAFASIITFLAEPDSDRNEFDDRLRKARYDAFNYLRENGIRCCILVDTIERYDIDEKISRICLSGLLNCCSSLQLAGPDVVECILFFPDELTETYKEKISLAPLKDFQDAIYIKWLGPELVRLAALRLFHFLEARTNAISSKFNEGLLFASTETAKDLLGCFLPLLIRDAAGSETRTTTFILRHTQLTPRHLIIALNALAEGAITTNRNVTSIRPISSAEVLRRMGAIATTLCRDVITTHAEVYPKAGQVVARILPHLQSGMNSGALELAYTQEHIAANYKMDLMEYMNMLSDIGAIGHVADGSSSAIIRGRFSYTEESRLPIYRADKLCLHPLYQSAFQYGRAASVVVHPIGSSCSMSEAS